MTARRRLTLRPRAAPIVGSSAPFVRQAKQWALGDDNGATTSLTFSAASGGQDVLAGSAILVFLDDENFNGSPMGTGTPFAFTISDSASGSYSNLGYMGDQYDLDATSALVRTNVAAGALTITANWTTNQWHGLVVAEIANVGASPTVTLFPTSGGLNRGPSASVDAITSGAVNLGSSPALIVGYCRNATDIAPTDGYPAAGTGFSTILTGINWNGKEGTSLNDSGLLQSRYLSNPGTTAATWTMRSPGPNAETFMALAVAFQ